LIWDGLVGIEARVRAA